MQRIQSVLTDVGKDLLVNSTGKTLNFTRASIGKTFYNSNIAELRDVVDIIKYVTITEVETTTDNKIVLHLLYDNSGITENTDIYEIGIYANVDGGQEVLLYVIQGEIPDAIPIETYNWQKEQLVYCTIENYIDQYTININMTPFRKYVDDKLQEHDDSEDSHQKLKEWIQNLINNISSSISNISWENILNKPSTYPPSAHSHNINEITGGSLVTIEDNLNSTSTTNGLSSNQGRLLNEKIEILKQSVIDLKQKVVNAINDKLGKDSGLTTNNTGDDYAWWIKNMIGNNYTGLKKVTAALGGNNNNYIHLNILANKDIDTSYGNIFFLGISPGTTSNNFASFNINCKSGNISISRLNDGEEIGKITSGNYKYISISAESVNCYLIYCETYSVFNITYTNSSYDDVPLFISSM